MAATSATRWVGGIEAGGTKFVCAVGDGRSSRLAARTQFETGADPARVLQQVVAWFQERQTELGPLHALGVASFGPVDLDVHSPTYGAITSTPKPGWRNTPLVAPLQAALGPLPIGFDTDVNGAALGERCWGAAQGIDDFLYVTIGTGIGGGGLARGQLLHGLVHPEMGHIRLPRLPGDSFPGVCPFHGDCWEGLCSGTALAARAGMPADELPADHPAWEFETHYIGVALANLICTLSPRRILVGGSVRRAGRLGEQTFFRQIRDKVRQLLNGYIVSPMLQGEQLEQFIVPPTLGDDAGICGAIALGLRVC